MSVLVTAVLVIFAFSAGLTLGTFVAGMLFSAKDPGDRE